MLEVEDLVRYNEEFNRDIDIPQWFQEYVLATRTPIEHRKGLI